MFTSNKLLAGLVFGTLISQNALAEVNIDQLAVNQCSLYNQLASQGMLGNLEIPSYCDSQKVVFVTSQTFTGELGGLEGADQKCNTAATQANLPGNYKAFLSTTTTDASERLSHANVPYVLTTGEMVADNWSDLTDGQLDTYIHTDEFGNVSSRKVWTATDNNGAYNTRQSCEDWTAPSQFTEGTGAWFMVLDPNVEGSINGSNLSYRCSETLSLYCVQQ